jgi:hypothetical protein
MPLFVNIRPRMTKHGGHAQEILETVQDEKFFEKVEEFEEKELLPIIRPKISLKDIKLMSDKEIEDIEKILVPGYLFLCTNGKTEYNLLIEGIKGEIVTNVEEFETKKLPELEKLSPVQVKILHIGFKLKKFTEEDLTKKGLPLDAKKQLLLLKKENLIIEENGKYSLSDEYVFSQLSKHACYNKIEFLNVKYNSKKEPKQSVDKIKEKLSKFTNIKDQRDCYVLRYNINYK